MSEKKKQKNKLGLLFPCRCVLCREILPEGGNLCAPCQEEAEVLYAYSGHSPTPNLTDVIHVFSYRAKVRQAILRYKFNHQKSYARYFGEVMARRVQEMPWPQIDVITFVPIGPGRLWKRGYNQSELLARRMGDFLRIPTEGFLKKRWFSGKQSNLSAEERKTRIVGKFKEISGKTVVGKRILLVDDVFTTGSTVCECARILKNSGALEVYCITLAKTLK